MAEVEETPVDIEEEVAVDDVDVDDDLVGDDEDELFVESNATEVKLFGKWTFKDIEVRDLSLQVSSFFFFIMKLNKLL